LGNGIVIQGSNATTGIPSLTYTVPAKVENQPDLMWADPIYNLVQTGHPVPLQMSHALTAIGFKVKGALNEVITGLSISGVDMAGSASMTTPISWVLSGTATGADYTASIKTNVSGGFQVSSTLQILIANDSWLMMLPQTLTSAAKVKVTLSDGTTREVSLMITSAGAINQWEAGKRIWYDITITPSGTTMVIPDQVELTYPAHTPAAQTLSVVCLDFGGNPDPTVTWKLTVKDSTLTANQWFTLSPNSSGSNARYSISGTGPRTVYMVATSNFGSANQPRSVDLSLDGSTVAATITQYGFPGPNYAGWIYVKQGSNGTGSSWSDALSTLASAFTNAAALRGLGFTVHGILVAGGNGRVYNETFSTVAGERIFGGWEGLAGTELPNNAGAPYTSLARNLAAYKAVLTPPSGITVSGAGSVLDGFMVRYANTSGTTLSVTGGAYIHAVELSYNSTSSVATSVLTVDGANSMAINVLIADNAAPVVITNGAKLINASIVNGPGGLINNATVLNTIIWSAYGSVSPSLTGTNTIQYCAFPAGSVPAGTGNFGVNIVNDAWISPSNTTVGPHFNLTADITRVPYMALNDRAPMLGSGSQALFDANATFLPVGAPKTDIKGNNRHVSGTDIGCYEDGLFTGTSIAVSPANVWLSGSVGNASKTIQIYSTGPWTVATPPANASLSSNSGSAGITTLTLTRNTTYGPASFTITNTLLGGTAVVNVDSYYIEPDELPIGNKLPTGNTGAYVINVEGGSETFTIVSYSPWITSATILPTGELQLVAIQSPNGEDRDGFITLAHANDPNYQVTFVVHQLWDIIDPFKYLVVKYTWHGAGLNGAQDIDTATEFTNSDIPPAYGISHFANHPYTAGNGINASTHKAVGWYLQSAITLTGTYTPQGTPVSQTQVTDNSTLLMWGGDAIAGQGETAFFKAPLITPADPSNDTQNLPRYITLDLYAAWFNDATAASEGRPCRVTIFTYDGGEMVKPSANNPNVPPGRQPLYAVNFYNAVAGTTPQHLTQSNAWTFINAPASTVTRSLSINKVLNGAVNQEDFHNGSVRLATITYDRYRRSATVTWHATEYITGVTGPVSPILIPHY
jgi:hypothetical protein